ncbi:MAG: hypothetical protein V1746_03235 [bacterium]
MKTSSIPGQPPSRSTAYGYLVTNLLVMPGIGSVMAERKVSGIGQIILASVGLLITFWGFGLFLMAFKVLKEKGYQTEFDTRFLRIVGLGFAVFLLAWLWSLFTSWQVIKEAKRSDVAL